MKPRLSSFVALAALALVAIVLPAQAPAQGVVRGDLSQPRTEAVGEAPAVLGEWVRSEMVQVPADDGGKWQFLVFCGPGCEPCAKLKADWKSNANLKALADENGTAWGWLQIYEASNRSQEFRFRDYQVSTTPVIVVAPPATSKQWPYFMVFREQGYNGDADGLARRIVGAIKAFAAKHRPKPDRPTPDLPIPDPVPPSPPLVTPVVPVVIPPNFPPLPEPKPVVPVNPTPGPGPVPGPGPEPVYPDGLQVVCVLADPGNFLERAELKIIRARLDEFKRRYRLNFDVRLIKHADAGRRYQCTRDELPAVFVTEGGKLVARASLGLLKQIIDTQSLDTPATPSTPLMDLPPEQRTPEDRVRTFLHGLMAAIDWIPAAMGWLGWLLVLGLIVYLIYRHRRAAKPAIAMAPKAAPIVASPAFPPPAASPDRPSMPDADRSPDWSRPSDRAWAEVATAQAAEAQAAQAREIAAAELASAEALLAKEGQAVEAAKVALTGAPPKPAKKPFP